MHFFQVVCFLRAFKTCILRQIQVIKIVGTVDECLVANYFAVVVDLNRAATLESLSWYLSP